MVEDVLSRPEFAPLTPSLWDQVRDGVLDVISQLLAGLTGGDVGAGWRAASLVALAALLALVTWVVVRFARGTRRDPRAVQVLASEIGRSPRDWESEAEGHEDAGRWRDAIRCRYRAVIAHLAGRSLMEEVPGRTAREYAAAVRAAAPDAAQDFDRATAAFESAWYSEAEVDAHDAAGMRQAVGAVLAAAPEKARRPASEAPSEASRSHATPPAGLP